MKTKRYIGAMSLLAAMVTAVSLVAQSPAQASTSGSQQQVQKASPSLTTTCGHALPANVNWKLPTVLPSHPVQAPASGTGQTQPGGSVSCLKKGPGQDVSVSFGWVIYVHFYHKDVGGVLLTALVEGAAAAASFGCSALSLGWLTAACVALIAIFAAVVIGWFQTAYARGGGIVLEWTYAGGFYGYSYVGDNWT